MNNTSRRQPGLGAPAGTFITLLALAMVDHANRSGNYSVLRDNSSTGFQINNNPAQLGQIFASLRASRIDLSNTLLLTPTYAAAAQLIQPDVFRLRGGAA